MSYNFNETSFPEIDRLFSCSRRLKTRSGNYLLMNVWQFFGVIKKLVAIAERQAKCFAFIIYLSGI